MCLKIVCWYGFKEKGKKTFRFGLAFGTGLWTTETNVTQKGFIPFSKVKIQGFRFATEKNTYSLEMWPRNF